ncbi:16325_t:CDS:2, partial [Cetraspora pellucida]
EFESFANPVTRSNSPDFETKSTSAKSDNETSNMATIKKTRLFEEVAQKNEAGYEATSKKKMIESIQNLDKQKVNIEVTYAICQVLNDSDKECCNIRLKTSSGSTSNLITHLLSTHGITQNGPRLSESDSYNRQEYFGVTCSWIDPEFKIYKILLSLSYVRYPHTANVIQEKLENIIANWGLIRKIYSITTDNESNMKDAINIVKTILTVSNTPEDQKDAKRLKEIQLTDDE